MKRCYKASFTIEASMIVPLLLLIFATVITTLFYWHDKNVLEGITYETAVVGAEKLEWTKEDCKAYGMKLIKGKLLYFPGAQLYVSKSEDGVEVKAKANHGGMKLSIQSNMPITEPEKMLRRKELLDEGILQE